MSKDTHKNQHWIPEVYLKAWRDPNREGDFIHRYESNGKYKDWRPVGRVFSEEDLYTIIRDDGSRDITVEIEFNNSIENEFRKIRNKLAENSSLTTNEHAHLVLFIALLHRRSPVSRDHWRGFMQEVQKAGEELKAGLAQMPIEKRRKLAQVDRALSSRNSRDSVSLEEWSLAANLPFGAWLPRHVYIEAKAMSDMEVDVLTAPKNHAFISSDRPVVWWDRANPPGRRMGLAMRSIQVSVPLSPDQCLVLHRGKPAGFIEATEEEVAHFNMRTLYGCRDFFFSNSPHLEVDWHDENGNPV